MVLEKMLENPLDSKMIKLINPKGNLSWNSLEGLMLKLKLQYFGHLIRRTDSLEKTLMQGKIEGRKRRGWQRTRWLDSITDLMDTSLRMFWEMVKDREAWHPADHGIAKSQTRLSNWTELRKTMSTKKQQDSLRSGLGCMKINKAFYMIIKTISLC